MKERLNKKTPLGTTYLATAIVFIALSAIPRPAAAVEQASRNEEHATKTSNTDYLAPTPPCPSDNFEMFLKLFASDERVDIRQRYTSIPLQYELPGYLLLSAAEETDGDMTIVEIWNPDRYKYFRYRFSKIINNYADIDESDMELSAIGSAAERNFPINIKKLESGDAIVTFGSEYETDHYTFKRANGCWFLVLVTNPRD